MPFTDSFRAMGTEIDVEIEAPDVPFETFVSVRLLFERQEAKFSRFREGSLLSRLNRGEPIEDAGFATACRMALEAHDMTRGVFNPMVLPALREAGYDRTFEELRMGAGAPRAQVVPDPRDALRVDGNRVELREGGLDLGGIVKGWTVDLAVAELGVRFKNVLANAGGDLRCAGSDDGGEGWLVSIDAPGGALAWEGPVRGALATSTTRKRRWQTGRGEAHHLIDPRTGLPAAGGFVQASAWGELAWRAECWAKAVLIAGPELAAAAVADGYRLLAFDQAGAAARFG
ncbi:MAG: FAD:protein FMN transferase [Hyphomicrobiales bacterium]